MMQPEPLRAVRTFPCPWPSMGSGTAEQFFGWLLLLSGQVNRELGEFGLAVVGGPRVDGWSGETNSLILSWEVKESSL